MAINDFQPVGLFTPEAQKLLDELTSSKNQITIDDNANASEKITSSATTVFHIAVSKKDPGSYKMKRITIPLSLDPKAVERIAYTPHQSLHYTTINDGYTPIEVRPIQQKLVAAGYDLGNSGIMSAGVDGVIGPLTRNAIKTFQSKRMPNNSYKPGVMCEKTYDAIMVLSTKSDSPPTQDPVAEDMIVRNDDQIQPNELEDVSFWSVLKQRPDGDAIAKALRDQLLSLPQQWKYESINLDAATGLLLEIVMSDSDKAKSYTETYKTLCKAIVAEKDSGSGNETKLRAQWKDLIDINPVAAYILSKSKEWQSQTRVKTSTIKSVDNFTIPANTASNVLMARNDLVKERGHFTAEPYNSESSDGNSTEEICAPGFSDMLGFLTEKVREYHIEQFLTTALDDIYTLKDAGELTPAKYDEIFPTERSLAMGNSSTVKNTQP